MKHFFNSIFILIIVFCFFVPVQAEESSNLVDATNSGFESTTQVKDTKWYKLINAYGDSNPSDALYKNISIKTDGGHTGDNYISMTAEMSWYSPAINIYPFIKDAGEDSYIISFWYKTSSSLKISRILTRALASDAYEEKGVYMPDIANAGSGNFYGVINGKSSDPNENGWRCFVSETFDVVEEQFDGDHNWWFCLDQLPAKEGAPFTLDIDDFSIVPESDFETPAIAEKKVYSSELSYITDDVKGNVFPVADTEAAPIPSELPDSSATDVQPTPSSGLNFETVVIFSAFSLLAFAVLIPVISKLIKSKKK